MSKRILIISDTKSVLDRLMPFFDQKKGGHAALDIRFSPGNEILEREYRDNDAIRSLDMRTSWKQVAADYDIVFSVHSKQIFPAELVEAVRCVNVHPGYNPYNRGYYPQVFSLLNKMPIGCTIHLMDSKIDHGPVLVQEKIQAQAWDTSLSLYQRIVDAEITLFTAHFDDIVSGRLQGKAAEENGNLNLKKDFDALRTIDLKAPTTFGAAIDRFRALTHGEYKNCYFIDETGRKIYLRIELLPDQE
jgi:methionyl-tRNA formyltransferase